jgi:hypothetical protein
MLNDVSEGHIAFTFGVQEKTMEETSMKQVTS